MGVISLAFRALVSLESSLHGWDCSSRKRRASHAWAYRIKIAPTALSSVLTSAIGADDSIRVWATALPHASGIIPSSLKRSLARAFQHQQPIHAAGQADKGRWNCIVADGMVVVTHLGGVPIMCDFMVSHGTESSSARCCDPTLLSLPVSDLTPAARSIVVSKALQLASLATSRDIYSRPMWHICARTTVIMDYQDRDDIFWRSDVGREQLLQRFQRDMKSSRMLVCLPQILSVNWDSTGKLRLCAIDNAYIRLELRRACHFDYVSPTLSLGLSWVQHVICRCTNCGNARTCLQVTCSFFPVKRLVVVFATDVSARPENDPVKTERTTRLCGRPNTSASDDEDAFARVIINWRENAVTRFVFAQSVLDLPKLEQCTCPGRGMAPLSCEETEAP